VSLPRRSISIVGVGLRGRGLSSPSVTGGVLVVSRSALEQASATQNAPMAQERAAALARALIRHLRERSCDRLAYGHPYPTTRQRRTADTGPRRSAAARVSGEARPKPPVRGPDAPRHTAENRIVCPPRCEGISRGPHHALEPRRVVLPTQSPWNLNETLSFVR
jgi:hypothetical protein